MKLLLIVFILLLLLVPSVSALEIWAEFYGPGTYGGGQYPTLNINTRFRIAIWAENGPDDPVRLAWSSPFVIWGSGLVTELSHQEIILSQEFADIMNYGYFTYTEGWDSDLIEPQIFNFSGISAGWQPNSGPVKVGEVELEIYSQYYIEFDLFCIDKGDPDNNTYDWLFDPPSPTFDQVCLDVVKMPCPSCGDAHGDGFINIFDVTHLIQYLYLGGDEPFMMYTGDANNDCVINIFDVTHLIAYLYLDGEWPECACVWPCP